MKYTRSLTLALVALSALATSVPAQRTRTINDQSTATGTAGVNTPKPAPAPPTVKVKYEGGLLGYGKTDGTLSFDDPSRRLIFRDKKSGKEMFSVSYDVVFAAWADTQSRRSTAGSVLAGTVPYGLGLPGLLWKKTHRYLALQYRDPDTNAEGIATFKLENKEILASVLYTFAEKAGLTQRGEAFIRRNRGTKDATVTEAVRP